MLIKKDSIIEIKNGLKFIVLDIKEYQGKEVALLQGVEDGILRFAVERANNETEKIEMMFIEDDKLIKEIAEDFDRQDNKI